MLRIERGFTQESFAKELGISAQAVSKWETGGGFPDIGALPMIAEALGTSIDSLFGEAEPAAPVPEAAEPVPGEVTPVEQPPEETEDALREVYRYQNVICFADMEPARADGAMVEFPDGSTADLLTRTIINRSVGHIELRTTGEYDRTTVVNEKTMDDLGDAISRHVEDTLRAVEEQGLRGLSSLKNLGSLISRSVSEAITQQQTDTEHGEDSGNLLWNGESIDSLELSLSGNADVQVEVGTPGQWTVQANGSREFVNSVRCIEDGNVLKVESLYHQNERARFFRGMRNSITICTGFAQGAELDITNRGSGDVRCNPAFASTRLSSLGSGDHHLGDVGNFTCQINGSGDLDFFSAANLDLTVRGSGDVNGGRIRGASRIQIHGSGDVSLGEADGELHCQAHGSGDIDLGRVDLTSCRAVDYGSGDITISDGHIGFLSLEFRGSGDFDGEGVTADTLEARLTGAADATLGRLTGTSTEQVGHAATLNIRQRG